MLQMLQAATATATATATFSSFSSFSSLLLLLLAARSPVLALSIKLPRIPLDIDNDPAPPPDKGPALSAGALRDPAYLPAEIGGIFGAYVLVVIVFAIALYTVGRRLRHKSERAKRELDMGEEMTKVPQNLPPVTPRSPLTNFSRPSDKADRNPYIHPSSTASQLSPGTDPSVDAHVMAADRETMSNELGDLFAQALEQDEAKIRSRTESLVSGSQPPLSPRSQRSQRSQPPLSPRSMRSLPFRENFPAEQPQRAGPKPVKGKPLGITLDTSAQGIKPRSRASSIISSLKSPRKKNGGRNMQISSPLPTPLSQTFSVGYASDEEPLSPINPPPPVPESQVSYSHSRNTSSNDFDTQHISPESPYSPITPRPEPINVRPQLGKKSSGSLHNQPFSPLTPIFPNSPLTPRPEQMDLQNTSRKRLTAANEEPFSPLSPVFPASPIAARPNGPPQRAEAPNPSTLSVNTNRNPSGAPLNSNPTPRTTAPSLAPTNNSTRTLPFRAFDPPTSLTSPALSQVTKTTVLERSNPLSPGSKTPWTGASVPYSPYQPHTPVTPFSPRLVTKHERKIRKKIEGRAPVMEMCKSEGELWDSAY